MAEHLPASNEVIHETHRRKYAAYLAQPALSDVHALRDAAVLLAKRQHNFRPSRDKQGAHFMMPKGLDGYVVQPETGSDGQDYYWLRRFTGRVARTDYRQWRMKIVESFGVHDQAADVQDFTRTTYAFTWNHRRVTEATKHIRCVDVTPTGTANEHDDVAHLQRVMQFLRSPAGKHFGLIEPSGHFQSVFGPEQTADPTPFQPALQAASILTMHVTGEDCQTLLTELEQFGRASHFVYADGVDVRAWLPHDHLYNYPPQDC